MPRGDKSSYSSRQKRKARHIEKGYEKKGVSGREAARRAWATVNKTEGGAAKKGGAGKKRGGRSRTTRGRKKTTRSARSRTRSRTRSGRGRSRAKR